MVPGNDTLESILNPIQVLQNLLLPLESNCRMIAKNFEHCFHGNLEELYAKGKACGTFDPNTVTQHGHEQIKGESPVHIFAGQCVSDMHSNVKKGQDHYNLTTSDEGSGRYASGNDGNRLHTAFLTDFFPQFLAPSKSEKTRMKEANSSCCGVRPGVASVIKNQKLKVKERNYFPFEAFIGNVFDQILHLPNADKGVAGHEFKNTENKAPSPPVHQFDYLKALTSVLEGKREDTNGFLVNLKFARVGGLPSVKDMGSEENIGGSTLQKLAVGLLSIPLLKVERLRSTLFTVSFTELVELLPQIGKPVKEDHPDKEKLFSVQDFFRYTEAEGKRFFQELDRDGDGQITLEDLEVAMRKRKLPKRYAHEFMCCARTQLFSKSFGSKRFLSLMEQKEPTILRAYTSLCLNNSGTLQISEILASLKSAGLPASEDNAVAMMRFLNAGTEASISYGHFRNFMLLLPSDRLQEDPRSIWFEAATVVSPPVKIPAQTVLKSALAGGLSCAFSTSLMHPVDTIKTRVQASTLSFSDILAKLPELGLHGLYKGSIPAILGQFSSHGLRTGICEASKLVLTNVAPTLPELQVQSIASFCGTFLGTAMRIPCEVLKQRLQAGLYNNVGEAIIGTWQQGGFRCFFHGTGATLCREIPFYVAGLGFYAESKKVVGKVLDRELEPWETMAVGALSGGITAVLTTPLDVIKTRMMVASSGQAAALSSVALSILRHEGPLGLFKGAVPRFFWVAPLGALNFAGYELAKKAMDNDDETS